MRIVSLIASATEIICALGLRDSLVGRSHECDTPDDVITLPALTAPKFDTTLSSRAIDTAVKSLVADGLSVYRVDQDALRSLAPDVIVTQDQCEVCAASLKDVEAAVCDWVGQPVRIVSLHPNSLSDIWCDVTAVGEAVGHADAARAALARAQLRLSALPKRPQRPRVLCVEWIDPLMTAGHWIPELIGRAGGESLLAPLNGPSPYVSIEDIVAADPDIIIVAPCGFDIARSAAEMPVLDRNSQWRGLRAVREGRVAIADGNKFFNRPSLAVVESAEIVSAILAADPKEPPSARHHAWQWWR
jgi:iron complex transport system substrate-binding protein